MPSPIIHKIDASGQTLGRLASQISRLLMGKDSPSFTPNRDATVEVEVVNLRKMKITGNKMKDKLYWRYSGYPGGMKQIKMADIWQKYPERVLKLAVAGMLPANKFKKNRLKRLKVKV